MCGRTQLTKRRQGNDRAVSPKAKYTLGGGGIPRCPPTNFWHRGVVWIRNACRYTVGVLEVKFFWRGKQWFVIRNGWEGYNERA